MAIFVGTTGWSVGTSATASFAPSGSALERYASVFPVAEINSSFHRPHRLSTWQRWRDAVPDHFRFSVKMPKSISHERKLIDCQGPLHLFLEQVNALGDRLGVLLLQLPPKLEFNRGAVGGFLTMLRSQVSVQLACEPRHPNWFEEGADALLQTMGVARVAADPARHPNGSVPGGWRGLSYFRLHGSPVMYRSSYQDQIGHYAQQLQREDSEGRPTWCIFDNTASSAAISDALLLKERIRS